MATTNSFSAMLNEYLPNELLKEELVKRDWLLNTVEKDNSWLGGTLIVPFKAAGASSVSFGALTASDDIAEDNLQRGEITSQPEMWGSMVFNEKDLVQHGKLSEQNLLKILPDTIDDFISYVKMCASIAFTNGTSFAKVTDATNAASGIMVVDRIERFVLGQKVSLDDDNDSAASYYVIAISVDDSSVTLSSTRGGSAANVSTYTVAQNAKFYHPGSQSAGFTSLKASLLSSANGGSSTLYGKTKTSFPYLQAVNISGTSVTASNLLDTIFDAFTTIRNKGKGMPDKVVMSYKNLGTVLKLLETSKGAYHNAQSGTKTSVYGWTEIEIFGASGKLSVVGVQEVDDDYIAFLDTRPSVMKIYSNGFFRKRVNPDGRQFYEVRATTGYTYIVDVAFYGDLVLQRPSYCGILHSISY